MTDRLHRFSALAKRFTPQFVWSPCRKLLTALITPIRFSLDTGHFRSSLKAAAVDRRGEPLPWYTYPAIDFLAAQDFTGRSVLEFGGGHSTLWWAKRAASVVALEEDADWYARLSRKLPSNASLISAKYDFDPTLIADASRFDVIVVDGLNRMTAAQKAIEHVSSEGFVILDNSEGHWGGGGLHGFPIQDLFRSLGFMRVDFYGYTPGVVAPHCTSMFFKVGSFAFRGDVGNKTGD